MSTTHHRLNSPYLGDGIEEALVVEWVTAVASWVDEGAGLVVVQADKVDVEVPSAVAGILVEQLVDAGATAAVGEPFCIIESQ